MDLEFRTQDGTNHRFTLQTSRDQTFDLAAGDVTLTGSWLRAGPNTISLLTDDGRSHLVHLARDESGQFHIQHEGRIYLLTDPGAEDIGTSGGGAADAGGDINDEGEILSPMPGKIVGIPVKVGDRVSAGELLVLSPVDGIVISLPLEVGSAAALGDPLIQLEVKEDDG